MISLVLFDHLEEWDKEGVGEGGAREKRYGDICICITDSLCYKAETKTPLESNYTPIKIFFFLKTLHCTNPDLPFTILSFYYPYSHCTWKTGLV